VKRPPLPYLVFAAYAVALALSTAATLGCLIAIPLTAPAGRFQFLVLAFAPAIVTFGLTGLQIAVYLGMLERRVRAPELSEREGRRPNGLVPTLGHQGREEA
jgi:hypothetical protein